MNLSKIPENWRELLLAMAKQACAEQRISEATLGNKILGNAGFFPDIRKGKSCWVDTFSRVVEWFRTNLDSKHKSSNKINKS